MHLFEPLKKLLFKYRDVKNRRRYLDYFKQMLLHAVRNGNLSVEDIDTLNDVKNNYGITEDDIRKMGIAVYETAFNSITATRYLTATDEQELNRIQTYLFIRDQEIQAQKNTTTRMLLCNNIKEGKLPSLTLNDVITSKGEIVYWSEPSVLLEEKIVRRRFEGGSQGLSFRISKGISYRIGGFRGHSIGESGVISTSCGDLIITNRRIFFRGDRKSFDIKYDRLLDLQFFINGLQAHEKNRSKPKIISYVNDDNGPIISEILTYIIDHINQDSSIHNAVEKPKNKINQNNAHNPEQANNHDFLEINNKNNVGPVQNSKKMPELDRDDIMAYFDRGLSHLRSGDHSNAIEDFSRILQCVPNNASCYYYRGGAKDELGNHKDAITDFNMAIDLEPTDPRYYFSRGLSNKSLENFTDAVQDFDKAIQIDPEYAEAYFYRGFSKRLMGYHNEAIEDYDRAIELYSDDVTFYFGRGFSRLCLKDNIGAINDYDRVISSVPSDAASYLYRGSAKEELGDHKNALLDLNISIELDPEEGMAYYNRGVIKFSLGDKQGALIDLKKAGEMGISNACEAINNINESS